MSDDFLKGWVQSEAAHDDSIALKRIYIDICGENLFDAVLFSQVVYWHCPRKKDGASRLKIEHEGHLWLAKNYSDWWEECRVPEGTARDSIRRLMAVGLIHKRIWHFEGKKVPHIRIDPERFQELIEAVQAGTIETVRKKYLEQYAQAHPAKKKGQVSVGSQRIEEDEYPLGANECKRWEPADASDGSQQMQTLGANECSIYKDSETTTEITSKTTPETTTTTGSDPLDSSAGQPPTPADVVDDEVLKLIEAEVKKICLLPANQAALLAKGPKFALATAWAALTDGIKFPAAFASSLMKGDGPPERLLQIAAVALELGITNRQEAEDRLKQREYAQLQSDAQQIVEERLAAEPEPEAVPPGSKSDTVSILTLAPSETPDRAASPAAAEEPDGLDFKPDPSGLCTIRDLWIGVMGSMQLILGKNGFASYEGTRARCFKDGVLTVVTRNFWGRDLMIKSRPIWELELKKWTKMPVKIEVEVEEVHTA